MFPLFSKRVNHWLEEQQRYMLVSYHSTLYSPQLRMPSPIYPSFRHHFRVCLFPNSFLTPYPIAFSLPKYHNIYIYRMSGSVFLPNMVGLTNCISPHFYSSFFSLYIDTECDFLPEDGNIDFSRQTVNITFGEKLPVSPFQGHVDLHLGDWDFLTVMEVFCGVDSFLQGPTMYSWWRSWLWLHLHPSTLSPGQKLFHLIWSHFLPLYPSLKKNKKVHIFGGSHCPCKRFVLSNELPHLLSNHKWLISYLSVCKLCKVTGKSCPSIKMCSSPSQVLPTRHTKSVLDLSKW